MAMLPGESVAQYNHRMQEETHAAWRRAVPPIGSGKMPSTSEMIVTKYMGHGDVDPPLVVTVKTVTLEDVGRGDDEKEQRWFLWFHEHKKGMRLNVTTIRILEAAWGMHTDLWIGKRLKLWWDPTVLFGGKPVGGIKVRLSTAGGPAAPPPGARFDPNTGAPLAQAQQPKFDPMTGKPLGATPGPKFDPNTGAPILATTAPAGATVATDEFGGPAPAASSEEFVDDDIPF